MVRSGGEGVARGDDDVTSAPVAGTPDRDRGHRQDARGGGPSPRDPDRGDPERRGAVAEAMRTLDRARFLPHDQVRHAHEDRALPLFHGQTGSQPSTVAAMLRLLQVPVGARVLDVGSGSGWTTALLARLVGPTGQVLGLELDPDLRAFGAANVASWDMPWARVEQADADLLGRPLAGGWDRILVSASALALPTELVDQLAPGGRLVVPVGTAMTLVVRGADGSARITRHGEYVFVPLRTGSDRRGGRRPPGADQGRPTGRR